MATACAHIDLVKAVVPPKKHVCKHARESTHPVIASAERGERWLYCYPDDTFTEY